jgi:hypothetical protein
VSDIGILNDPTSLIEIILLLGSPGLLLGATPAPCYGESAASPAGSPARWLGSLHGWRDGWW